MKTRRPLAAAGLAAFLLGELAGAHVDPRARWDTLLAMTRRPEGERRLAGTSSSFDPAYGVFLEAVRRATPPQATVSLDVPLTHELYTYEASYILAPRQLVRPDRIREAQYAAVYGAASAPGARVELPVPNGSLFRLR